MKPNQNKGGERERVAAQSASKNRAQTNGISMLTDGPGGGVHSAGAATADREVLNQDGGDKPSDKAMTCSRSRLACRGGRKKKNRPHSFYETCGVVETTFTVCKAQDWDK